jgi:hypothetical protein
VRFAGKSDPNGCAERSRSSRNSRVAWLGRAFSTAQAGVSDPGYTNYFYVTDWVWVVGWDGLSVSAWSAALVLAVESWWV